MTFEEEFLRDKIISNLANYEMYYQVSLGSLISDSKTQDINPSIELQYALGSIYELYTQIINLDNAKDIFQDELKKQAAMDALQNFVNENMELVKDGTLKIEPIVNAINDNMFFHQSMNEICDKNYDEQVKKWEEIITNDVAKTILDSVIEMQK